MSIQTTVFREFLICLIKRRNPCPRFKTSIKTPRELIPNIQGEKLTVIHLSYFSRRSVICDCPYLKQ